MPAPPLGNGGAGVNAEQKSVLIEGMLRTAQRIRKDVARLRADGLDALGIAAELGLTKDTVELVLTTPAPLRKCGP